MDSEAVPKMLEAVMAQNKLLQEMLARQDEKLTWQDEKLAWQDEKLACQDEKHKEELREMLARQDEKHKEELREMLTRQDDKHERLMLALLNQNRAIPEANDKLDHYSKTIKMFTCEEKGGMSFINWFNRYNSEFTEAKEALPEDKLVKLLLNALGEEEYKRLLGRAAPSKPDQMQFAELVAMLTDLFNDKRTLFQIRYDGVTYKAPDNTPIDEILEKVNLNGETSQVESLTIDEFKLLLRTIRNKHAENTSES